MMIRNSLLAAAAVSFLSLSACGGNQDAEDGTSVVATPEEQAAAAAALAADPPTPDELAGASRTFGFIAALLRSPEVSVEVKNTIFGCLYENPLGELSVDLEAEKVKRNIPADDADRSMQLLALMCGFDATEQAQ
ncbi:hypothetical protein KCG44_07690 [Pacificimonas sp. WHA3]|uniref:Lipoprotein n=1 Tax=Pacificimonas pallii TaxID=2827236 RepID=A0ABS6SEH7_9SPHN|nr:hypothetical protein [Pacificimonas pallii]MBV7256665.1 hypothetical protein [Pacificimonas pallii]